jgi:hypothetical protein
MQEGISVDVVKLQVEEIVQAQLSRMYQIREELVAGTIRVY